MIDNWLQKISPCQHIVGHEVEHVGWVEPPRYIYDHELVMFSSGEIWMEIDGGNFHCEKDSFIIVPPGKVHSSVNRTSRPAHRHWIHFDWSFQKVAANTPIWTFLPAKPDTEKFRLAPEYTPNEILQGQITTPKYTWELFDRLNRRWNEGSCYDRLTCRGLLLELLLGLLSGEKSVTDEKTPKLHIAQRTRRLLEKYSEIPVNQAPALPKFLYDLGCSYPHICREFRKAYGSTPVEYINALRIERAKLLLHDTNLPIIEVARRVGFDTPAYFSRVFKKVTGINPIKFVNPPSPATNRTDLNK